MEEQNTAITLDATDLRILHLLQHDASLSNQDLAAAAHTSPATCLRRVKRFMGETMFPPCAPSSP